MSDNSRITIILSIAMALAVVLSVLLFVYMFYRAQTRRIQDLESPQKTSQCQFVARLPNCVADIGRPASNLHNKPLPPAPQTEKMAASLSPPEPSGVNQRPPSILQRRQAAPGRNGTLPLRGLQLGNTVHSHHEAQTDQANTNGDVGTISVGLSPDPGTVPFNPTPRAPRLPRHTISRLRGEGRRPPIDNHPIWESEEEEFLDTQDVTMPGNRF